MASSVDQILLPKASDFGLHCLIRLVCPNTYGMVNALKFVSKVSDKMAYANNADQDQAVPEGAVWSGSSLLAIPLSKNST